MEQAGNIAEAVLGIHNVMQTAQDAAQQYMDEIRAMRDETREQCDQQLQQAQEEGAAIIKRAIQRLGVSENVLDEFLKECKESSGEST